LYSFASPKKKAAEFSEQEKRTIGVDSYGKNSLRRRVLRGLLKPAIQIFKKTPKRFGGFKK
jgi:hypothetical protein